MNNSFVQPVAHSYLDQPPRQVPGFHSLHRMSAILLAEQVPPTGTVLVLGAGGGLELKALAECQPGWHFAGVDPSAGMLQLAADTSQAYADRIRLHQGYIDTAPAGPFDGAICLLTFHFIAASQRLSTLRQLRQRLKPGAPLIIAHHSFAQTEPERTRWIKRHLAFGHPGAAGAAAPDAAAIEAASQAMQARLSILPPADEEALLNQAGFSGISLFYAAFSFKGWVAYA